MCLLSGCIHIQHLFPLLINIDCFSHNAVLLYYPHPQEQYGKITAAFFSLFSPKFHGSIRNHHIERESFCAPRDLAPHRKIAPSSACAESWNRRNSRLASIIQRDGNTFWIDIIVKLHSSRYCSFLATRQQQHSKRTEHQQCDI